MDRYDAFISYSHAADGRLAPAVQNGLQRLARKVFQRRALRVFRDERYKGTTHFSRDGFGMDFPAFLYEGRTIWGLTYRMICGFLEMMRGVGEPDASGARSD